MFKVTDIETKLDERPFIPFRIITSSGQSYDITHPELVLLNPRYLVVGKASNDNPRHIDTISQVSVLHITDMQNLPTNASR